LNTIGSRNAPATSGRRAHQQAARLTQMRQTQTLRGLVS
jgi:hypothetical protein